MLINWRDMLSMMSSPGPLFLFSSLHCFSVFLQLEGDWLLFLSEAEEVNTISPAPSARTNAITINLFLFFMVVVLQFDESIGENVTVNIKFTPKCSKPNLMNSQTLAIECGNHPMNRIASGCRNHTCKYLYLPQIKPYERKISSADS